MAHCIPFYIYPVHKVFSMVSMNLLRRFMILHFKFYILWGYLLLLICIILQFRVLRVAAPQLIQAFTG